MSKWRLLSEEKKIFSRELLIVATSSHNGKYLVRSLLFSALCKNFYSLPHPTLCPPDVAFVGYSNNFTKEILSCQEKLNSSEDYFSWSLVVTTGSNSFETYYFQLYVKNFIAYHTLRFCLQTLFLLATPIILLRKFSICKKS